MLSKESRIRNQKEIESVFRIGKTWQTPFFSIKYSKSASSQEFPSGRAAFSFSKKFLKKAVQRNRLKRRISGHLEREDHFRISGLDLVFYLPAEKPFPKKGEVKKELEKFFQKVYNRA